MENTTDTSLTLRSASLPNPRPSKSPSQFQLWLGYEEHKHTRDYYVYQCRDLNSKATWRTQMYIQRFLNSFSLRTHRGVTSKALSKNHTGSLCSFNAGWCVAVPGAEVKGRMLFMPLVLEWYVTWTSHNVLVTFSSADWLGQFYNFNRNYFSFSLINIGRNMSDLSYTVQGLPS